MAETIGNIQVVATINTKDYDAGKKHIERGNDELEGGAGKSSKNFSAAWTVAIAAVSAAAVMLTKEILLQGAELEQQLGGSEAVFEKYAKSLQKTAETSYKDMGLSQAEFLAGANKMGSLFQGAGVDVETSMKLSAKAIQRASDVASIMGIDTTFALESVAGAAKGNFTMMDNLGVKMDVTSLSAYALQKGLGKTFDEMSQGEKVQLSMQMFLEQTAKYAGNYAKENDTLAGSLNTTKKVLNDFMAGGADITMVFESAVSTLNIAIGDLLDRFPVIADIFNTIKSKLQPTIDFFNREVVPVFNKYILPVLKEIANYIKDNFISAWNDLKEALGPFADEMVPVAVAIGVLLLTPLIGVGVAIGVIIAAISVLVKGFGAFMKWASKTQEAINKWLEPSFKAIGEAFRVITWYIDLLKSIDMAAAGKALIDGFVAGMTSRFDGAKSAVKSLMTSLAKFFPHSPAKTGPFSGMGYTSYSGQALMQDFAKGIISQTGAVSSAANSALSPVAGAFGGNRTGTLAMTSGVSSTPLTASVLDLSTNSAATGGDTYNVTVNASADMIRSENDKREFAEMIVNSFNQTRKAKGLPALG